MTARRIVRTREELRAELIKLKVLLKIVHEWPEDYLRQRIDEINFLLGPNEQ